MNAREMRKAKALYLGHMLANGLLVGLGVYFGYEYLDTFDPRSGGEWLRWSIYTIAVFLVADVLTGLIFRRKTKPWHMSKHPADRWPRR